MRLQWRVCVQSWICARDGAMGPGAQAMGRLGDGSMKRCDAQRCPRTRGTPALAWSRQARCHVWRSMPRAGGELRREEGAQGGALEHGAWRSAAVPQGASQCPGGAGGQARKQAKVPLAHASGASAQAAHGRKLAGIRGTHFGREPAQVVRRSVGGDKDPGGSSWEASCWSARGCRVATGIGAWPRLSPQLLVTEWVSAPAVGQERQGAPHAVSVAR